ncbi:unnamed protein product [Acanthosepion pharaonis]|uniref:Uncharacterized protein n=1 Tax=Acanthosepion pharaonis TaxID=158019 RepID=A0A812AUG8_ACAPH|nr:unnamed protein product [Sepia pharaonis]
MTTTADERNKKFTDFFLLFFFIFPFLSHVFFLFLSLSLLHFSIFCFLPISFFLFLFIKFLFSPFTLVSASSHTHLQWRSSCRLFQNDTSCSFSIPAPFYKMTSPLTRPVSLVSVFSNFSSLSYYFLLCCPHFFRTILPSFSSDPKSCQRSFIIIRISSSAPNFFPFTCSLLHPSLVQVSLFKTNKFSPFISLYLIFTFFDSIPRVAVYF